MDKPSELSKPVAWLAIYHGDVYDEAISITRSVVEAQADRFGWESALTEITPLYSQEYVSALQHESAVNWEAAASLNVENQELKKRIAELERANQSQDDHINQQQDRIDSLEKKNGYLGRSLGAAEKRLATPVRLQSPWVDKAGNRWLLEGTTAEVIRAAGFKVEGDAQ
ncbi:TPA: hypothetical protein SMI48_002210 [Serratia marcescens]|nr:hypothetical protein [Serratia marcescens]